MDRAPLHTALANCLAKVSWHIPWHSSHPSPSLLPGVPQCLNVGSILFVNVKVLECVTRDFQAGDYSAMGILKTSNGYLTPQKFCHKKKIKGCTHTHRAMR